MGDIFEDKLRKSLANLRDPTFLMNASPKRAAEFTGKPLAELADSVPKRVNVDPEHCFTSFDAYRKVLASDIDVVLLCTPPGHRPEQFEAAVNAGKHIFTEKPIATDPVWRARSGVRRRITSKPFRRFMRVSSERW
jgi:predicted dehydrogenase